MKKFVMVLLTMGLLSACMKAPECGSYSPAPPPPVDDEQTDISNLLKDENDYRLGLGQTKLSEGLSCSVVQVASGQWLSTSSPGYPGSGVIVTSGSTYTYLFKDSFNQQNSGGSDPNILLPSSLRPMFVGLNFKISCSGQIVVRETGWYNFSLNSDDGSILTVDGTQVINNDGNHGMTLKSGSKYLRRGVRTFSISYAQTGSGNFGLVLLANGDLIDGKYYAH